MKIPTYKRSEKYEKEDDEFFRFGGEGSHKISDARVNIWIKGCIERLEDNEELEEASTGSGDTIVIVSKSNGFCDEGYEVIVSHDYRQCIVSKGERYENI